jgi:hypothetical protein
VLDPTAIDIVSGAVIALGTGYSCVVAIALTLKSRRRAARLVAGSGNQDRRAILKLHSGEARQRTDQSPSVRVIWLVIRVKRTKCIIVTLRLREGFSSQCTVLVKAETSP